MEELFTKVFKDSTANDLNLIYYKQCHHHLTVFYRAIQAQRLHEESYCSAQGGPSYASVTAQQTLDPDMLEMKRRLAELKTTIQVQQQQLQQTSALPAPNPPAPSLPPGLATKIQDMMATMSTIPDMMATMASLRAEIAELRSLHQPTSTPSPAQKKVCPNAQPSESHLSEASLTIREDKDAEMDHVS
jgi:hypothetical protein